LALAQSTQVKEALERLHPGLAVALRIVKTTGDALQQAAPETPAPGKGIFIKEIEEALLRGEADFAVHSCKDLPVGMTPGLKAAAVPRRESPEDVLICRPGTGPEAWPAGGRVATGSLRRGCQWKERHPGAVVVAVRGNIDTRVRKLRENPDWSGLILAEAGLKRLPLDLQGLEFHPLPHGWMLPAPGQGALLLQCREEDAPTEQLLQALHDEETFRAIQAERAVLEGLGGGCMDPLGALARIEENSWRLEAVWYPNAEGAGLRAVLHAPGLDPGSMGFRVAEQLKALAA
jgi:hydroxymethylbilane synthase